MQETLDPALTRPGRFDRRVAVPVPDVRGRLEILEHYLKVFCTVNVGKHASVLGAQLLCSAAWNS